MLLLTPQGSGAHDTHTTQPSNGRSQDINDLKLRKLPIALLICGMMQGMNDFEVSCVARSVCVTPSEVLQVTNKDFPLILKKIEL